MITVINKIKGRAAATITAAQKAGRGRGLLGLDAGVVVTVAAGVEEASFSEEAAG